MTRRPADAAPPAAAGDRPGPCPVCGDRGYVRGPRGEHAFAEVCTCSASCATCRDRRYVFVRDAEGRPFARPCTCASLFRRVERYNAAHLPARYAAQDLFTFEEKTPALRKVKYELMRYLTAFAPGARGLVLSGPPGTGKTHLLCGLLTELTLERGLRCEFVEFGHLLGLIKQGYSDNKADAQIIEPLVGADVLAIDELGKGRANEWELGVLDALVNRRYNQQATTLFTSNYPPEAPAEVDAGEVARAAAARRRRDGFGRREAEDARLQLKTATLADRVGDRIFSRLSEMCAIVMVEGPDHRQQVGAAKPPAGRRAGA